MSNNNTAVCLCTVRNRVNDDPKHRGLLTTVTADGFSLEKKQNPDGFIVNSCVLFWFGRTFQGTICKLLKD